MFNAKLIAPLEQNNDRFELFTIQTIKDINDNEVQIPQSIGIYSIADLEMQKASFQREIDLINEKIDAINELSE